MPNKNVVFHHIRQIENGQICSRGGYTVAMETNDEKQVIAVAAAFCHPKDNFCKHTGRAKAAGRLKSKNNQLKFDPPIDFAKGLEMATSEAFIKFLF